MEPVGDITLTWGESLRWDDRRNRLWYVDCGTQTLHWLDDLSAPSPGAMALPSLPTGIALTDGDDIIVCLDDGLHAVDADRGTTTLVTPYPPEMQGRANDANADGEGGLLTGTLNLAPGPGAAFRWSTSGGWQLLDDDVANFNGPVAVDGTVVYSDTLAGVVYRRDAAGRHVICDHRPHGGAPDGATADSTGAIWSCSVRAGKLIRSVDGTDERVVDVPAANPSDVCFGGPDLDQLFLVSIALDLGGTGDVGAMAGRLLTTTIPGIAGRPEARVGL
jgi:sugar lactone lactonase YvrE